MSDVEEAVSISLEVVTNAAEEEVNWLSGEIAEMARSMIDELCKLDGCTYEPTGYYTPERVCEMVTNGYVLLVPRIAGDIVGMAWMVPYGTPEYPHMFLHMLYTRPEHRRKGVATALMDRAEAYVVEHEYSHLDLEVGVTNIAVAELYKKRGYYQDRITFVKKL